jgi:hypothetical protein
MKNLIAACGTTTRRILDHTRKRNISRSERMLSTNSMLAVVSTVCGTCWQGEPNHGVRDTGIKDGAISMTCHQFQQSGLQIVDAGNVVPPGLTRSRSSEALPQITSTRERKGDRAGWGGDPSDDGGAGSLDSRHEYRN